MKAAGRARRPLGGLRLKVNLLLVAIQVPALVILSYSTTRGVGDLVRDMARSRADDLVRQFDRRLDQLLNLEEELEVELHALLRSSREVQAAAVFLAEGDSLARRAHWGPAAPWDANDDDYRAFHQARSIDHVLEPHEPTLTVVHRPLRNAEGQVMGVLRLELDHAASVHQVKSYQRQLFVGMVVVFALTVLVLFGGMHLLVVRPVKRLVEAMRRVEVGQLEPVAESTASDEVGWLAHSYNDMVHRLKALLDEKEGLLAEVRDLNLNLQRKVDEATRSLARSHRELERAYHDLYASQREHERLEQLASVGQVAREIAHEFSTPLNVISGTLQMLLEDPALPSGHRERLTRVFNQTDRLIQICRDTLTPLKMPAPDLQPAQLNALVEEVAAFMAPAFAARGVEFRPSLTPRLPPVRADLHQMEQVLLNLIQNALDALPGGGRITVETRVEDSGGAPAVVLSVRDNGVGIPPQHLPRIFDPFFSTKGAGKGTGLGLAICKEIVEGHRGAIRIESEPGRGSTVTVRLPALAMVGEAAA